VVWIVDDSIERTHGIEHLRRRGYQVVALPPSPRGPAWIQTISPDVVVLEVDLDHDEGMSLLHSIRTANPSVPIFIYSRTDRYRDDFTSWLADDYVHKTDDVGPLCDAIESALA
jgi:DNA-binding response OmpR family regulator